MSSGMPRAPSFSTIASPRVSRSWRNTAETGLELGLFRIEEEAEDVDVVAVAARRELARGTVTRPVPFAAASNSGRP